MPQYRALNGLNIPINQEEHERIVAARDARKPLPFEERRMTRYEVGDTVNFVPADSLHWLIAQGHLEELREPTSGTPEVERPTDG